MRFQRGQAGAIYARLIEAAYREKRIVEFPVADTLVHTTWDLGSPSNTTVWYWQIAGREIRVIDCDVGYIDGVETVTQRAAWMLAKATPTGSISFRTMRSRPNAAAGRSCKTCAMQGFKTPSCCLERRTFGTESTASKACFPRWSFTLANVRKASKHLKPTTRKRSSLASSSPASRCTIGRATRQTRRDTSRRR